ncbi:unnamed protein product [Discula destructiva]
MILPKIFATAPTSWSLSSKALLAVFILFVAFKVFSSTSKYLRQQKFKKLHGCQPCRKFPVKDPILGLDFLKQNIEAVQKNQFLQLLCARMISAGPTWQVRVFGTKRSTFTADPANVQTIMSLKFDDYKLAGRRRVMSPLLGSGVFTSDDHEWKNTRTMIRPHFAKEQVTDLGLVELHLSHLFALLPRDDSTVDLPPLFHCFTLDSATHFLFGKSTNTLTDAKEKDLEFARALKYSIDHMAVILVVGRLQSFWGTDKKFEESNRICRAYVGTFVEDVMRFKKTEAGGEKKGGKKSFLQDLAAATDDVEKIQGDLLSLLLAGRDTTASLLCSLFYQLSRRPDVWKALCEEVEQICQMGGERPTYDQLRELKYARWCINEVLRLYPPVPTSAKVARRDTVLPRGGGPDGKLPIYIPAGRKVFWSSYTMHRNPETWGPDAEEFRPERWENARPSWTYIPFNGGPRICIGQQYAITETLYVIVRMVQEFESVEARDDLPWAGTLGLTVAPTTVKVGFRRRAEPTTS